MAINASIESGLLRVIAGYDPMDIRPCVYVGGGTAPAIVAQREFPLRPALQFALEMSP